MVRLLGVLASPRVSAGVFFSPVNSNFSLPAKLIPYLCDVLHARHTAVSHSGGQAQGVLKVNGFGNARRFKHHMDRLIIYKLFKVEPIQNTVGLR